MSRELSDKGLIDRKLVTEFLADKGIDIVMSSPYKRAVDTVKEFVEKAGMHIVIVEDFRERKIDSCWIEDFNSFCKRQWEDFDYKLTDGECLAEVQRRNINALEQILRDYKEKTIVVGSHGTALSTIINYYDKAFDYTQYEKIKGLMPWVVEFSFEKMKCVGIKQYNLLLLFSLPLSRRLLHRLKNSRCTIKYPFYIFNHLHFFTFTGFYYTHDRAVHFVSALLSKAS